MFANVGDFAILERADLVLRTTRPALTETTMERRMATPTQARVREYFNYDPDTGVLTIQERPRVEFATDLTYAKHISRVGKPTGSPNVQGYMKVCVDGVYHSAHRIAWLWMFDEWPEYPAKEVDHINGDRSDNRIANLRVVTKSENQRNSSSRINNSSGVHGVNWKARGHKGGRWVARIWNGPRHVYLGTFETLREAAIARRAAERVLGFTGADRQPRDHKEHAKERRKG